MNTQIPTRLLNDSHDHFVNFLATHGVSTQTIKNSEEKREIINFFIYEECRFLRMVSGELNFMAYNKRGKETPRLLKMMEIYSERLLSKKDNIDLSVHFGPFLLLEKKAHGKNVNNLFELLAKTNKKGKGNFLFGHLKQKRTIHYYMSDRGIIFFGEHTIYTSKNMRTFKSKSPDRYIDFTKDKKAIKVVKYFLDFQDKYDRNNGFLVDFGLKKDVTRLFGKPREENGIPLLFNSYNFLQDMPI